MLKPIHVVLSVVNYLLFVILMAALAWVTVEANAEIKIAVIDSGYTKTTVSRYTPKLCKKGHYDMSKKTPTIGEDEVGHGSLVVDLIEYSISDIDHCFVIIKVDFSSRTAIDDLTRAVDWATIAGVDYVNMSLQLNGYDAKLSEHINIGSKTTKFFIAAGNSNQNLNDVCMWYPSCFKENSNNVFVVGALDFYGDRASYSNFGQVVDIWETGDVMTLEGLKRGTSFATPRALGKYILMKNGEK